MSHKLLIVAALALMLLATTVVPASAVRPEASQSTSFTASTGPVNDGRWLIFLPDRIRPDGDCETGGNCSMT